MDESSAPKRESSFPLFSKNFAVPILTMQTHPQDVVEYAQTMRK
jgi:hypothetical protein